MKGKIIPMLKKWEFLIEEIVDERYGSEANGIWIYLKPGFNFEGCSAVHELTWGACAAALESVEVDNVTD